MSLNDSDHEHEHEHEQFIVDHFLGPDDEPALKKTKKNNKSALRKAPNAPKRFKSSYICFFMAKQSIIKEELGKDATVTSISKRSAEMWKGLSQDERAVWDDAAFQDKKRYLLEKAQYTGPWQVPWKRVKKDPSAPKRPMSAFLYFSQGKRTEIKNERPEIKNTEVSRVLGEMWRNLSKEEQAPFKDREQNERETYKVAIAEWRQHDAAIKRLGEKDREMGLDSDIHVDPMGNQYAVQGHQITPLPQYHFPTNGKQPVILGPKGIPYVAPPATSLASLTQKPMPVMALPPNMFDDSNNPGVMMFHNHGVFDFSNEHVGGDSSHV